MSGPPHAVAGMGCRHAFLKANTLACVCTIWGGYTERGMVIGSVIAMRAQRGRWLKASDLKLIFVGEDEQKTGGSVAHGNADDV